MPRTRGAKRAMSKSFEEILLGIMALRYQQDSTPQAYLRAFEKKHDILDVRMGSNIPLALFWNIRKLAQRDRPANVTNRTVDVVFSPAYEQILIRYEIGETTLHQNSYKLKDVREAV